MLEYKRVTKHIVKLPSNISESDARNELNRIKAPFIVDVKVLDNETESSDETVKDFMMYVPCTDVGKIYVNINCGKSKLFDGGSRMVPPPDLQRIMRTKMKLRLECTVDFSLPVRTSPYRILTDNKGKYVRFASTYAADELMRINADERGIGTGG